MAPLRPVHRARRFFGSLWPLGPRGADAEWALAQLLPGELELWAHMKGPDRRHAVQVARRVERALGHEAGRPVLAAALLHDVGKTVSGLGTYGRVVATLCGAITDEVTQQRWVKSSGFTRRVGLYLTYPPLGADLLELAGSDELTVAWAEQHHLPPERWTVPQDVGQVLAEADDC